jgi:UDP-N-acetylmuramate--alanine ligase
MMEENYRIDFNKPCRVYFIGIGGISMSGIAEILIKDGFTVSGSDAKGSELTEHLSAMGAEIQIGQRAENITDDIDCAVYTAAVHPDNPEYRACAEKKIPLLTRAEMLGQVMKQYRHSIAIAGTHGKTTTTSMITHILLAAKTDPTVSVGGILPVINGNTRIGGHDMFVMEACEYTNSFLSFCPTMEVILNIEADHLDFFKDIEDIRHSFHEFVMRLPENGTVIINSEIRDYQEIVKDFKGKVVTVGFKGAHVGAEDIRFDELARPTFTLTIDGKKSGEITLSVPGEHNVHNALAAIAVALELKLDPSVFTKGLASFGGAERRFEKKGELHGVTIIDDYAHHPQEIEATLKAAQHYPHKRIVCVFQPHTYSRTKALLPQFAKALSLADQVVLADIFPARETDTLGVSSGNIMELIREGGGKAEYIPTFDGIETYLLENLREGDLCITMGAGDVYKIGERLLGK